MQAFHQLDLIPALQRALTEQDYQTPTPIQSKSLPAAIDGHDILGCAQTGSGKTAAFALPILNWLGGEQIKAIPKHPIALILAPTRELAIQIGDSFQRYGKHLPMRVSLIYGGVNQTKQVRELERGAHIVVATPGRLLDLMTQGLLRLDELDIFVLDEADRMLDMGFLPDLKRIIKALPEERQSLFFSATLPAKIRSLAKQLLWRPTVVDVSPKTTCVETIDQRVMHVNRGEKLAILSHLLQAPDVDRAIVFTKTKRGANRLAEKLQKQGITSTAIHGNKSQSARQKALSEFRDARIQVLVATDLAARGIDISGVTHVFNFDIPNQPESYVHRIGRTARAGASGIAVSLCTPEDHSDLRAIERLIGKQVRVERRPAVKTSAVSSSESSRRRATKSSSHSPQAGRPKQRRHRKPKGSRRPQQACVASH